ncbi:hypothetical protein QBC39DRAFT_342601, partial [Podospora conica]
IGYLCDHVDFSLPPPPLLSSVHLWLLCHLCRPQPLRLPPFFSRSVVKAEIRSPHAYVGACPRRGRVGADTCHGVTTESKRCARQKSLRRLCSSHPAAAWRLRRCERAPAPPRRKRGTLWPAPETNKSSRWAGRAATKHAHCLRVVVVYGYLATRRRGWIKTVVMCVRATYSHVVPFKRSLAGCSIEIRRGGVGLAGHLVLSPSPSPSLRLSVMAQRGKKPKRAGGSHPRRRKRECEMAGLNVRPARNIETMQRSRQPADPVTNAPSFLCCPGLGRAC